MDETQGEVGNSIPKSDEQSDDLLCDKEDGEIPANQENPGRNPDGTFKKGFSGNPTGGIKKKTIWNYLREGEDETKIREFINDPKLLDKVAEYILGKPKQPLVGGDEDDEPIKITGINFTKPDGIRDKTDSETIPSVSSTE